jgi:Zn-dependent metalloprotease
MTVAAASATRGVAPLDILNTYGNLFGIADSQQQLVLKQARADRQRNTHTTYQQVHDGVPVFAGLMRVHMDEQNRMIAINGTFIPDIAVSVEPVLSASEAITVALEDAGIRFGEAVGIGETQPTLYVFRKNLARGISGTNHLVWEVEVGNGRTIREFVYVDAHKGGVVERISGIHETIYRRVYDQGFGDDFLVWEEGDLLPYGETDIDNLIDYTEDTYNLVASATNGAFLSWDGMDGIMNAVYAHPEMSCPNASWNGISINHCPGITADDTVAHEWGHGFTDATHNLIYAWQPGALNESYSDIYGEVVDLINGAGTDSPVSLRSSNDCSTFGGTPPPAFLIDAPPEIAGSYTIGGASFNPTPPVHVTADVELVNDGENQGGTGSTTDACQSLVDFTAGNIALIDRGGCSFLNKVTNAETAGAVGVIIVNNQGDTILQMGGGGSVSIPSGMIGQSDGNTIKGALPGVRATITLSIAADPSLRWLHGEDDPAFGGAIRDMWNPHCYGDPGKVTTPYYQCSESDRGGVHTNSGVPNHAFALLVDGGTYNGYTITAIGLTKAFHLYWRAQSVYQVPVSDFADHADALEQSCADLIGVDLNALSTDGLTGISSGQVITPDDCAVVADAIAAVELRTRPTFCNFTPLLDPNAPPLCGGCLSTQTIFIENWESGLGAWTAGTHSLVDPSTFDTPDWAVVSDLPDGRGGSAAFVADLVIGNCGDDIEAGVLYLESPAITISPSTAALPLVAFDHWVATEPGWDGGNVKIAVNGGAWTLVPGEAFTFNPYNQVLNPSDIGNDNPLAGEPAFTGTDSGSFKGTWGNSQINLSGIAGPGDTIQIRFEMGLDGCNGVIGWYVDNVHVYACPNDPDSDTVCSDSDNCPDTPNFNQADADEDGVGDACDNCWEVANPDQRGSSAGCPDPPYTADPVCGGACADVMLEPGDLWYSPDEEGGVTLKKPVCLDNPEDLVGGLQFDLCEYDTAGDPIDCMECIDCELTERTTLFDCEVLELPSGCCRVLLFCKNPGCAINPGLCDIATVVYQTFELSPACPGTDCITQVPENIIVSDYDGNQLKAAGLPGTVCPFACGDVCPADDPGPGLNCGDGAVDIYDVMCEVDFALTATTPDDCQSLRADVPTGTPPNCSAPDGTIDILDIMVLIDMALNRQDCCTFYYTGVIY